MDRMSAKQFNEQYGSRFKESKSKYNNKKEIIDGKKFDSASEGKLYSDLILQKRQGLIIDVECQAKEELWAYGIHIANYYVDFKVIHNDGRVEFIEHKSSGTVTGEWRMKYKMLQAKYKNDSNVIISTNWYKPNKSIKYARANTTFKKSRTN